MGETVFKGTLIVGTSDQSFSHAIEVAVRRARQTLRNLSWFVVEEQRGGLQQGRLEYQVTLRVFFKLEEHGAGEAEVRPSEENEPDGGKKKKGKSKKAKGKREAEDNF
jgi:flavin-binding protein dodecin